VFKSLAIFSFFFLVNHAFAVSTLSECHLKLDNDDNQIDGHYEVIRDGDALFAVYRHQSGQDYTRTDDVSFIIYEGEDLLELSSSGVLSSLCEVAQIDDCKEVIKVNGFGIEQLDDGSFEMDLWQIFSNKSDGITLAMPFPDFYSPCATSLK